MSKFTASNTATVERISGSLEVKLGYSEHRIEPWILNALREYLQWERDGELGRRKPWKAAKPGDVWLLTLDGVESAFYPSKSLDRCFTPVAPNTGTTAVHMDSWAITAGRRIFPESD